ncbi:hypothetical protein Poli38472_010471 [Pythium oligandrum]|uniref:Uncharacterized protein n=1 Tax=Pythium oligandrum TaxID=41045 RepID=A0A8K1FC87_PYTOL|nr:hypothetical protein Poli38472_010471 [Pythium oligandrum]|eukprot:TMW55589.1 hypothetical protein Poli38472_010471 [Pythium oligandrum]
MLWNVMKTLDPTFRNNCFVVVGSSGAGKTCFLLRLGFYLACIKKQKVLNIRRMKTNQLRNAVVYLHGNGCAIRKTNLDPGALAEFRSDPELQGAIVLLDGYPQRSVEGEQPDLLPFNILATTSEYDAKRSDPSHVVVLPAWQKEDLFRYAHETDWIDTPEIRNLAIGSSVSELASGQYYYSGGSLRDFCMDREELKDFVAAGCNSITDPKTYNLVSPFGGGRAYSDQVDPLRRHYIPDRDDEQHYYRRAQWKTVADAGYALELLTPRLSNEKLQALDEYSKSTRLEVEPPRYLKECVRPSFPTKMGQTDRDE